MDLELHVVSTIMKLPDQREVISQVLLLYLTIYLNPTDAVETIHTHYVQKKCVVCTNMLPKFHTRCSFSFGTCCSQYKSDALEKNINIVLHMICMIH